MSKRRKLTGTAAGLIRFDVRGDDRALKSMALFHDGKMYLYDWGQRCGVIVPWPPDKPIHGESAGWWNASLMAFRDLSFVLAGILPQHLTCRYAISVEREDAHYIYVRSKPRTKEMQSVFEEAWAAVDKKEYGLRLLAVSSPPSVRSRYTLLRRQCNLSPPVTAAALAADLPREWTLPQHPPR
jgi:hypothetical protein